MNIKLAAALLAGAVLLGPTFAHAQDDAPRKVRVLVLQPEAKSAEGRPVADAVAGLIPVELAPVTSFDVLSTADVQQMVELEAEKAAMGCADNSCLAELAGALGADLVVYGDVSQLGALFIVNINLFDSVRTRAVGRKSIQTKEVEELPAKLSAGLRSLVIPYLKDEGLPIPADWAAGGGVASEQPAASVDASVDDTKPDETVASVTSDAPAGGGVSGANEGGGFAILPWSLAGGGAMVVAVGLALAIAGVVAGAVLIPGAVEAGLQAAADKDQPAYDEALQTYNLGYGLFYGGLAAAALLTLGGGALAAGGASWALMGGE